MRRFFYSPKFATSLIIAAGLIGIWRYWDYLATPGNPVTLFGFVVVGILADWFWQVGWRHLANPQQPLDFGPPSAVMVRIGLSLCIAALTYLPIHRQLDNAVHEAWVLYLLAFQYGFFWQRLLSGIPKPLPLDGKPLKGGGND